MFITNLTLYKFIFLVALLVAEWIFLFRFSLKSYPILRMTASTIGLTLITFFFPILKHDAISTSLMFTFFFAITIPLVKFCWDISWQDCIFCTVAGYSVQHLASVFYSVVTAIGRFDSFPLYSDSALNLNNFSLLIMFEVYALVYWLLYQLFGTKIKRTANVTIRNPALILLLVITVLVEIIVNAFVTYRWYESKDYVYYVCACLSNIICTLSVLVIQFSFLLQKNLTEELDVVYQMLRQEKKQFEISKETIDAINIKCHDMRHMIHSIGEAQAINPQALFELEQSISIYDSITKTGNQALDIILAEKSLYCQKYGITISYIIDGARLNFMSETDIYSLFGNLLDNAIKSVMHLECVKRVISITVRAEQQLLSINSHNYFDGTIIMNDGIPMTDNVDKQNHGFGVKSMTLIAEKYGGTISFDAKNQIFNLNVLIPIPYSHFEESI